MVKDEGGDTSHNLLKGHESDAGDILACLSTCTHTHTHKQTRTHAKTYANTYTNTFGARNH